MREGFIKLKRTAEAMELLNDGHAFILLTVIALRARRTDEFNIHNLKAGEALIGDHERYGLTRQEYRSAQRRLRQWGLAAFKPTTNGTVARLLDQRIYDVNRLGGNDPPCAGDSEGERPRDGRVHGGEDTL